MSRAPRTLRSLESLRTRYGGTASMQKLACVRSLESEPLPSARAVERFHEILLWIAAYPDDATLRSAAVRALDRFARRRDIRRFREALVDSGIAGTEIHYRFFWMMVRWLAHKYPRRLVLDWNAAEFEERLRATHPVVLRWDVAEAVRRSDLSARDGIDRVRGRHSDAVHLVHAIERLSQDTFVQEFVHDSIDPAYVLRAGADGLARTTARWSRAPVAYRSTPPDRTRPDLRIAVARPPISMRAVPVREAERLIDLARESMVTRHRDLVAFSWGDARDVTWIDDGDGLAFVLIGSVPERRLPLPAVYGGLMMRNGIPVGYVQLDALLRGAEVSFNTFPTFRGGEAGFLFARTLAVTRHVFGAEAFSIEPYQLGAGNDEGIETGAFWFYYKFGFRPRDARVSAVLAREIARMHRNGGHRSDEETLRTLASAHVYWSHDAAHRSWLPAMPRLGLHLAHLPNDAKALSAHAAERLGVRSFSGWARNERLAWDRLAPLIVALDGVERWSRADRLSAVEVVRSKGGRRERDFVHKLAAHSRFVHALVAMLRRVRVGPSGR